MKYRLPLTLTEDMLEHGIIYIRGGRSGRKVHCAYTGTSSTMCGHWLKTSPAHYRVRVEQANKMERCEKCFTQPMLELEAQ